MIEWQWHQLDHMQITFTSLHTDNHDSTSPLSFFTSWMPPNQQPQSTEGIIQTHSNMFNCLFSLRKQLNVSNVIIKLTYINRIQTSGYATWFMAGGAICIGHYDVIDDIITRKL